jgi:molybdopterin-guanine dinucleotide biosynthesis protein A
VAEAAAVILAGGRGARLGGAVKANLKIGGVRLIDRVVRAAGGASPILVARGPFADTELPLPQGAVPITDPEGSGGPRAGVWGAVQWLKQQLEAPAFLLSVAVDTPFFPADFLPEALARIGDADAVVARFRGQEYPTNTLWRVAAIVPIIAGPGSLRRLFPLIRTVWLDWDGRAEDDPFTNANTIEDMTVLEGRAKAHFGVGKGGQTR